MRDKPPKLKSYKTVIPYLLELEVYIERWSREFEPETVTACLAKMASGQIAWGKDARAKSILNSIEKGEFGACTIGEALELAQVKWATKRTDKLSMALLWLQHMEPRRLKVTKE